MIIGFTGTRDGLADAQRQALLELLEALPDRPDEVHHGECLGADEEFECLARQAWPGVVSVAHPCDIIAMQSTRTSPSHRCERKRPLVRNGDIVDVCDVLIACPNSQEEQQRSGTWSTVRAARRMGKPVIIVFPDGSVGRENVA